jgi:hypothetical protein
MLGMNDERLLGNRLGNGDGDGEENKDERGDEKMLGVGIGDDGGGELNQVGGDGG